MTSIQSDEQSQLERAMRDVLRDRSPIARVRAVAETAEGYDADLWRELSISMGLTGVAVPAELGGAGGGIAELAIVSRTLGAALTPSPFFASAVLAGSLLVELASQAGAQTGLLEAVASGDLIATVGYLDEHGSTDLTGSRCTAVQQGTAHRLSGVRSAVPYAAAADLLLVPARLGTEVGVFAIRLPTPGAQLRPLRSLDITARSGTVELNVAEAVQLSVGASTEAAIVRAFDQALTCLAASQTGGMQQCLADTVSYVRTRRQFGRAIGSFQAVKHGCADMYVAVEVAQATTMAAITALPGDTTAAAELAAITCGEGYKQVSSHMIQYMGGMGYTWEADAHLYYKRAWTDVIALGDQRSRRRRLAEHVPILSRREASC